LPRQQPASLRTHTCGELGAAHIGAQVTLCGWVHAVRDHGGILFCDLRDRYGVSQVVFDPRMNPELHRQANELRPEYVVRVTGEVRRRPEGTANPKLATGEIEVVATALQLLNRAEPPVLPIADEIEASEEVRLRYRFLDLRRSAMQRNLMLRHRVFKVVRDYFDAHGFLEVETPMLTKSTPEGARDYLVPSRLHPGSFYALPQSPQLFKQIFMVSGLDRYAQLVRCFRDEDLRADRQPEFTQLDMEMSFVTQEDIINVTEGLMVAIFREVLGRDVQTPFPRFTYEEAMSQYGCDRPDLRFGMTLRDVGDIARQSAFEVFRKVLDAGGQVKGLCAPGAAGRSRAELDRLTALAQTFGAKGLAWMKVEEKGLSSPIDRFFPAPVQEQLRARLEAKPGDLMLFVADQPPVVAEALSRLRLHLGRELQLIPADEFKFCWVVDFPLFAPAEGGGVEPCHHPFTSPRDEDIPRLETEPLAVKAKAYDIILNGSEIGGGSIRIHDSALQERIFRLLRLSEEEVEQKFGFFLRALRYGAPPHGGIALGMDRIVAILCGLDSIRDVIAFPKTQRGICPLTEAPTPVSERQLRELGLRMLGEGP